MKLRVAIFSLCLALIGPVPLFYPFGATFQSKGFQPPVFVTLPHVADANARLSLDPTGKVAGYQVIQDDNSTTYTFQGDGADADAGLWVTGAGVTSWNGAFQRADTKYFLIGTETFVDGGPAWQMGTDYFITIDATYPWLQAWDFPPFGGDPAPSVTRNPVASPANWNP